MYPWKPRNNSLHDLCRRILAVREGRQRAYQRAVEPSLGNQRRSANNSFDHVGAKTWNLLVSPVDAEVARNWRKIWDPLRPRICLVARYGMRHSIGYRTGGQYDLLRKWAQKERLGLRRGVHVDCSTSNWASAAAQSATRRGKLISPCAYLWTIKLLRGLKTVPKVVQTSRHDSCG